MDMIKKEIQKGVVLYVGSAIGMKDNKIAVDIDVADDIKEVEVWYNFKMFDTNKSFPNVPPAAPGLPQLQKNPTKICARRKIWYTIYKS